MKTSTMTVKGQVTVPKELRDAFGWKVGDEVAFLREKDGVKIVRAERQLFPGFLPLLLLLCAAVATRSGG